jgi:hypothetical protein
MSDQLGQFVDCVTTATRKGASQYRDTHAIVAVNCVERGDGSKRN